MNVLDFHEAIEKDSEILALFERLDDESLVVGSEVGNTEAYDNLNYELEDLKEKFFSARREVYMQALKDFDDEEFLRVFQE